MGDQGSPTLCWLAPQGALLLIDWLEGRCVGGGKSLGQIHDRPQTMANIKITFDQLQTIAGGGKEQRRGRRAECNARSQNRKIPRQYEKQ